MVLSREPECWWCSGHLAWEYIKDEDAVSYKHTLKHAHNIFLLLYLSVSCFPILSYCPNCMFQLHVPITCPNSYAYGDDCSVVQDSNMVCFFWRSLECELCKILYPAVVKVVDPDNSSSGDEQQQLVKNPKKQFNKTDSTASYRRMSDSRAYNSKQEIPDMHVTLCV